MWERTERSAFHLRERNPTLLLFDFSRSLV